MLPCYEGTIVHDSYGFYQNYQCRQSLCNAHLLRELQAVMEEKRQKRWAGSMTDLLLKIKAQVDKAISRGEAHLSRRQQREIEKEYERILKQGLRQNKLEKKDEHTRGRAKQSKARNLLDRLNKYKDQVLLFMKDFLVPFDNNQAERDLRMMKVKQKISGCLRSPKGAMIFCRIRSYLSTMKKQGKNLLWAIQQALIGFPIALSPPP